MKEHQIILDLAAQGKLPDNIDGDSHISVSIIRELIDAGYLKAIAASSFDGNAYINPRITLAGRDYLDELKEKTKGKQMEAKSQKGTSLNSATVTPRIDKAWIEIENEYDVSKRLFGKRISFVKDEFKRKVIFRDTEQAFLLAHQGFNKPSVVLAGGVIEELLRLYLDYKGVVPTKNTLDSYIKACEDNGLLKTAIHRLADSVRQFRNIVHLERESSSRHSISKATAKGAVSSIFTIANDFNT
jgi:hypothetical protein